MHCWCVPASRLSWLVFFMPLNCMWFSRQWKRPSRQLTTLTQLQPALLWYLYSVLQKFTFLAAKMTRPNTHVGNTQGPSPQEQLDKYITELQSYGGTNGKQFWMDCQAMYHSLAPLSFDLLSAPASEAYVERIFSLYGMLTAGIQNWLKNLEMRVFLKLNNNILSWMLTVL